MSEKKAYNLDFKKEPPKAERKGRGKPEYTGTIEAFLVQNLESGVDYAKVEVPSKEKISNVFLGLKHAIKRMGRTDELKVIKRKRALYLITKDYSDKRGWVWKIERKKKK